MTLVTLPPASGMTSSGAAEEASDPEVQADPDAAADAETDWGLAVADEELRERRLAEARDILEELKSRDPGGDIDIHLRK